MCKDCGYQACGSCESHHSRGTLILLCPRGLESCPSLVRLHALSARSPQSGRALVTTLSSGTGTGTPLASRTEAA